MKKNTKEKLVGALVKLSEKKSIDQLTVSDLTKEAHINRGTFYLSFDDINHFILSIEMSLLSDLNDKLVNNTIDCGLGQGVNIIFTFIDKNRALFKIFMVDSLFLKEFEVLLDGFIRKQNTFTPKLPIEYSRTLLLNSTLSIIKIWIFESEPRSVRQISDIFYKTRKMSPIDLVINK